MLHMHQGLKNRRTDVQLLGVHRNQFFKFRPEPDPTGTGKKFRPEVPAGTGTNILNHIQSYVTLSAARQADTSSHQGESSQMLE
jgi:hypothetical protein